MRGRNSAFCQLSWTLFQCIGKAITRPDVFTKTYNSTFVHTDERKQPLPGSRSQNGTLDVATASRPNKQIAKELPVISPRTSYRRTVLWDRLTAWRLVRVL